MIRVSFLLLMLPLFVTSSALTIHDARKAFDEAVNKEESGRQFLLLAAKENINDPLLVGYIGAVKMIMAKHYFNPWTKLNSFNEGKDLLESSIKAFSGNAELRFLRFSIQANSPKFLNYNMHLEEDKRYLLEHIDTIKDKAQQGKIVSYLRSNELLTEKEKQQLKPST